MKKLTIALAALALLIGTLACTITPRIPDININVPTIDVGELREERRSVPLSGTDPVDIEVVFGAGTLELEAGVSDELFSGTFRYNVERWAPEVTSEGDYLKIQQGGDQDDWGIPSGNIRNRWELEFSPDVPLEMDLKVGAGEGELDLTGLGSRVSMWISGQATSPCASISPAVSPWIASRWTPEPPRSR